jgi:hypothetical protein
MVVPVHLGFNEFLLIAAYNPALQAGLSLTGLWPWGSLADCRFVVWLGWGEAPGKRHTQTNFFALKARHIDRADFVSALQALMILWDEIPGPALVGLASAQAVILRAFGPENGVTVWAE